jgi:hypothetical protein
MKQLSYRLRQALNGAQRRFIRSKPGSVLILVVALLVLMALIGTAYMTMAQFDRAGAAQHQYNTEIDLLLDGVISVVKGTVDNDLFVNGSFRPVNSTTTYNNNPPPSATQTNYNNWNGVGYDSGIAAALVTSPGDPWLSSRIPEIILPTSALTPTNVGWYFITNALNGTGTFDSPYTPTPGTPIRYSARNFMVPGALTVGSVAYPSFTNYYAPTSTTNPPLAIQSIVPIIAADTDGDGVADAGLFKLPVGTIDGVTYYAAVRIVDNCAAINASIALKPNPFSTFTANAPVGMPGDFSPVNLDLEGMVINPNTELYNGTTALLSYRFNNLTPSIGIDEMIGANRLDIAYMSYGNAKYYFDNQWMQLGRRLDNPGSIGTGTAASAKYQALSIDDMLALTRGFVLSDPTLTSPALSPAQIERSLSTTLFAANVSNPYAPGNIEGVTPGVHYWFNDNFNFATGANTTMPMRPLLVTRNPVSNFAPAKFVNRGDYATAGANGPFQFGDSVTYPTGTNHRYVCINPTFSPSLFLAPANPIDPATASPNLLDDPNWAFVPWATSPTKVNANTATFQQLYAAYWAVMSDTFNTTNNRWEAPFPNAFDTGGRMFRNPDRHSGSTKLTPWQIVFLRAAIAAVNTMDLRDADDDVTSRTIQIPADTVQASPTYFATVYGTEKEPYITQVIARNDMTASNDWVGIEIYNPYPTAITTTGWQLTALDRTAMTFVSVGPLPATIGPYQRVVIESDTSGMNPNITGTASGAVQAQMPTLASLALGKELFLMRPRKAAGTPTSAALRNNTYNESGSTSPYTDYVPVDSFDFTNLPAVPAAAGAQQWIYIRPSDPNPAPAPPNKSWHCVYPGPWNAAALVGAQPTLAGTAFLASPTAPTTITSLGMAQPTTATGAVAQGGTFTPTFTYQDVPLQINNVDFGGANKVVPGTPPDPATGRTKNYFPYGGFARNGDLLQVTFIGAYKIWTTATNGSQTLIEVNSLPMDSAMATANDAAPFTPIVSAANTAENIGRFAPIDKDDAAAAAGTADDFTPVIGAGASTTNWRYHWAMRLFDFLTVLGPQDDYFPEVYPWYVEPTSWPTVGTPPSPQLFVYLPPNVNASASYPQAVANVVGGATYANSIKNNVWPNSTISASYNAAPNYPTEETAPINGLVNINSANWRVLAAVPWQPATVAGYQAVNAQIAQAIVKYRDVDDGSGANPTRGHGPFKSIFELNSVVYPAVPSKLRDFLGNTNSTDFTLAQGNLSPINGTSDGIAGDFESRFNLITRVGNLITTRSDSYTAYILVQGWLNAETDHPTLKVQRRAAIIIDRSTVTPNNTSPSVINVPLN